MFSVHCSSKHAQRCSCCLPPFHRGGFSSIGQKNILFFYQNVVRWDYIDCHTLTYHESLSWALSNLHLIYPREIHSKESADFFCLICDFFFLIRNFKISSDPDPVLKFCSSRVEPTRIRKPDKRNSYERKKAVIPSVQEVVTHFCSKLLYKMGILVKTLFLNFPVPIGNGGFLSR